jgi:hypothetical protein
LENKVTERLEYKIVLQSCEGSTEVFMDLTVVEAALLAILSVRVSDQAWQHYQPTMKITPVE